MNDNILPGYLPESFRNIYRISGNESCWPAIEKMTREGKTSRILHHREEFEEIMLHDFDHTRLKKAMMTFIPFQFQPFTLFRILSGQDMNYMLTLFYKDVTSFPEANAQIPDMDGEVKTIRQSGDFSLRFASSERKGNSLIRLQGVNTSRNTVISNLVETFQRHEFFPVFTEFWFIRCRDKKVRSMFIVECEMQGILPEADIQSLKNDFERYLHQYIKPMSVFDIVGPSMVGPSSSHTAGANKIGQIARNIILAKMKADNCKVESISIRLLGSFRDTGPGHKTPSAIGGGLNGYVTDDARMLPSGEPEAMRRNGIELGGSTAAFRGYSRGTDKDDQRYRHDHNSNIAEILVTTDRGLFTITGFSIGGGNVEVRYLDEKLEYPITGKEDFFLMNGKPLPLKEVRNPGSLPVIPAIAGGIKPVKGKYSIPFNSFEELEDYIKSTERNIVELIMEAEMNLQGSTREEIMKQTAAYWEVMEAAAEKGIKSSEASMLKLTGKDAQAVYNFLQGSKLFDNLSGKAVAYAIAVNEVNARSGVIVACPTAGSCGILPGVLKAYKETARPSMDKLYESILVSGFMGMILFNDVSTAGADYGCQAEIGVGAAMSAAALSYLEGGDIETIIHAFTLAIKNSLGLICDPIAGLVEVPCVKRNGIFASVAVSAAMMSLSGVRSYVSPDEVVMTMKEVGDKLHRDYKETAGGGLARTRDGKAVERAFESEVKRFFGNGGIQ
ncbi:MAG: L-serine ammonia-lyase, iron-sulfur-dependent, subunit alpha [Bacteroidota bacterium]